MDSEPITIYVCLLESFKFLTDKYTDGGKYALLTSALNSTLNSSSSGVFSSNSALSKFNSSIILLRISFGHFNIFWAVFSLPPPPENFRYWYYNKLFP